MDKKSSNIKERILELAKIKGVTKEKMCIDIGKTYANFKGKAKNTPLNSKTIENLFALYPDINLDWLFTGDGKPLKDEHYKHLLDRVAELSLKIQQLENENRLLRGLEGQTSAKLYIHQESLPPVAESTIKPLVIKNGKKKKEK